MAGIPNEDVGWDDWKAMALRLYASLGDAGFELFDTWSKRCEHKYDPDNTIEAWEQVTASPPDRTGVGGDIQARAPARLDAKAVRMRAHLRGYLRQCRRGTARDRDADRRILAAGRGLSRR